MKYFTLFLVTITSYSLYSMDLDYENIFKAKRVYRQQAPCVIGNYNQDIMMENAINTILRKRKHTQIKRAEQLQRHDFSCADAHYSHLESVSNKRSRTH